MIMMNRDGARAALCGPGATAPRLRYPVRSVTDWHVSLPVAIIMIIRASDSALWSLSLGEPESDPARRIMSFITRTFEPLRNSQRLWLAPPGRRGTAARAVEPESFSSSSPMILIQVIGA
jgi:hypothetical protein